ncbi:thioredoxin-disulfide reductase [Thermincola potens]|uniref:Thioredoxin reductase n=1 Tax=Thermincola potens (strain JR) TaxID=635013 RepID=D5X891_THEPJ|nr:thioredoxin reductase [Thermincola potens JR]
MMDVYDIVIIGGGPAGITAGMYAARAALKCILIERGMPGGQAATTDQIENYPGFPEGIGGPDLMMNMHQQALKFGLETKFGEVNELKKDGQWFLANVSGQDIKARAVIIATGTESLNLGVEGEQRFRGRGVSYCATCDGAFFKGLKVAVIGGGDAALEEGMFLTRFASKVYLVHRRNEFRATKVVQERLREFPQIELVLNSVVTSVLGDNKVEAIKVKNLATGEEKAIAVDGVFVYIGKKPNSELVKDMVQLDERGYIITDQNMQTSLPGLFAAGDVRVTPLRQVVTAVSDGAVAAVSAEKYIEQWKTTN